MNEDTIANISSRIERCRRLATQTTDDRAARILRDMANEAEADLAQLLAEQRAELQAEQREHRHYHYIPERHHQARHQDNEP